MRQTRKLKRHTGGFGFRIFKGIITDSENKRYRQTDFSEADIDIITSIFTTFIRKFYKPKLILAEGFCTAAVQFQGTLPPMNFILNRKKFIANFDKFKNYANVP